MTRLRQAEIKKINFRRSITVVMALLLGGPVVAASQKIGEFTGSIKYAPRGI